MPILAFFFCSSVPLFVEPHRRTLCRRRLVHAAWGSRGSLRWVFGSNDKLLGKPGLPFAKISPDCAVSKEHFLNQKKAYPVVNGKFERAVADAFKSMVTLVNTTQHWFS